jgi:hypothetical protein
MIVTNINTAFVEESLCFAALPYGVRNKIPHEVLRNLAGREERSHAKFLRQMMICAVVKAPLCWWTEFDTYKVGVTRMSTSAMHIVLKHGVCDEDFVEHTEGVIERINCVREQYMEKKIDRSDAITKIKNILPGSYFYMSFITMNYEVLRTMEHDRRDHKLKYWNQFLNAFKGIPYYKDFICTQNDLAFFERILKTWRLYN